MKKVIISLFVVLTLTLSFGYANSGVPISILDSTFQSNDYQTLTIHNVSALGGTYWLQFQWNQNTYKFDLIGYGQEQIVSGWWDIFVPSVDPKKIDAMYIFQDTPNLSGYNILTHVITGTIDGNSIQLFFTDYSGYSFIGTFSDDTITGNFDQTTPAYFKKSTFHIENFTPGENLPESSCRFSWTQSLSANSYSIKVMRDNSEGNCDDSNSCSTIWNMDDINQTEIIYNSDASASEALIPGNIYRVRINAYSNGSIVDTTMDVHFGVSAN